MKKRLLFSLLVSALSVNMLFAANISWKSSGTTSAWATATNWVGNIAPVAADNVTIPTSTTYPTITTSVSRSGTTTIATTTKLTVDNGGTLTNTGAMSFASSSELIINSGQ